MFVFSPAGREGDELLARGLVEAPPRTHVGQGTSNRTFHFGNGYLELIWVSDEVEARSPRTAPTRLWERANWRRTGWSPVGICLHAGPLTDSVFERAWRYEPAYFPTGFIEIAETLPHEPLLFRLPPLPNRVRSVPPHGCGAKQLTAAQVFVTQSEQSPAFARALAVSGIAAGVAPNPGLALTLDVPIGWSGGEAALRLT